MPTRGEREHKIRLVLNGLASEGGHVRASDLQRELYLLLTFLQKAEEALTESIEPGGVYYVVTALRHDSPTTIELEARATDAAHDNREQVLSNAVSLVTEVRTGSLRRKVDTGWLQTLGRMSAPVGKTLASVEVTLNGTSLSLGREIRRQVAKIIKPEEVASGTLAGMLESINIHGEANRFWVYPDIGPSKVRCEFPSNLRRAAIEAVGQFVEVAGLLRYKTTAPYPYAIQVETLTPLAQSDPPDPETIRGITVPLLDIPSEELVRQVRDALR